MILKGSKRGGAVDLGKYLLKAENEHVEVHEIRGFVADDVISAFPKAYAISRGTKCRKFLFSLSLSPHEKESVQDISRKLYLEHGWQMPDGMIDASLPNPLNFDRKEWFEAQRTGQDPRITKAAFQRCWQTSDSGKAFRSALEQRGYYLARGDRRGVVAIDIHGEVYAVARWANVKTRDVANRTSDLEALPSVSEIQSNVANIVREKLTGFIETATAEFARVAQSVEAKRLEMVDRHRAARRELQTAHDERLTKEARERADRYRKGLLGLWDRVSGKHAKLRTRNEQETVACAERDAIEKQNLIERQLVERQHLQNQVKRERQLQVREIAKLHNQLNHDVLEESERPRQRRNRMRHQKPFGPSGP